MCPGLIGTGSAQLPTCSSSACSRLCGCVYRDSARPASSISVDGPAIITSDRKARLAGSLNQMLRHALGAAGREVVCGVVEIRTELVGHFRAAFLLLDNSRAAASNPISLVTHWVRNHLCSNCYVDCKLAAQFMSLSYNACSHVEAIKCWNAAHHRVMDTV